MTITANQVKVTDNEMMMSQNWLAQNLLKQSPIAFSFYLDNKHSDLWLTEDKWHYKTEAMDEDSISHELTYELLPNLKLKCAAVEYLDFPIVEWTVYIHNEGIMDSPIFHDLLAADLKFTRNGHNEIVLHHQRGSQTLINDFELYEEELLPGKEKRIATSGGRSSNLSFPYFNLDFGGEGVILGIGWPGQWAAQFNVDQQDGLHISMGQEKTHFKLLPGEKIRTPLVMLQFWEGELARSQNIFRRWMNKHVVIKPQGEVQKPFLTACSSHQFSEMENANEENQKQFIDRYLEERIPLDYWWMDAGWYINNGKWVYTGTWEVDKERFPNGLRAITDHGHAKGVGSIVWFEPERVTQDTWLTNNRPEWLLTPPEDKEDQAYDPSWRLFNHGNPEAWDWLIERVDSILNDEGIDVYREDFNVDPLFFWRKYDEDDRQGITENLYIQGLLSYYDELRLRHNDLLIDTCASGGRRLDLETLRRATPLLRSDYIFEPIGQQSHTFGLSQWLPFHGTGIKSVDEYEFRSSMTTNAIFCYDLRETELDYNSIRRLIGEWKQISPYFSCDFYPLTPYTVKDTDWIAWQYDSPEAGEGVIMAFRRTNCLESSINVVLNGLYPESDYILSVLGTEQEVRMSGKQLLEQGYAIEHSSNPGSVLVKYRKA